MLLFCSQCHNSAYCRSNSALMLYCYKKKRFLDASSRINGCDDLLPESRALLESGYWKPQNFNPNSVYGTSLTLGKRQRKKKQKRK